MKVMGCDYSTRNVDVVKIPLDGTQPPEWHRFPLTGNDAFDRTRSVADAMPGRTSQLWDDVIAVGIEHPGGKYGTGDMLRVQGAVLGRIPARMLVMPLPPGKWRTLNGLKGNASKDDILYHSLLTLRVVPIGRWGAVVQDGIVWPQDAHDAHLIALATRALLEQQKAA